MDFRNPKKSQSPLVPEDVIEEILSRLPVKSLLRFKCVSKPWRSLISSKRFAMIQLEKSIDDRSFANWRVIFSYGYGESGLKQCSMRDYINDESIDDPSPLENPINYEHPISGTVVGSINGVLCILKKLGCFSLYNPSTRILHELPKIDKAVSIHGFGWDETSDAYKVFVVVLDSDRNKIGQLYCPKTNSWKTVGQGSVSSVSRMQGVGMYVGGMIHWLSEDRQRIESFDLESEVFEATELPFKPDAESSMWVGETSWGCIGVVVDSKKDNSCDTWTMKEYGVKESWAKEAKARRSRRKKDNNCYGVQYCIDSLVSPLFDKEKEENVDEAIHIFL